jgi:hypothetical protein
MKALVKINNKNRIIADKSLGGNELEAVYPQTALEDIEKLHEITEQFANRKVKPKIIIEAIRKAFEE